MSVCVSMYISFLSDIGHPFVNFPALQVKSSRVVELVPDGDDSLPSLVQALLLECEQRLKKQLMFVHGSGTRSLTKPCCLRASASTFFPEKANSKFE